MSIAIDEYGRPFIILKEQENKKRLHGLEALKANINAAKTVSNIIKTSFGPKGMDKILVSQDGDVTVSNDGAEILEKMDIENEIGQLLVQLSKSQDNEIGDGTTGVVILAGALLNEALPLLEKGIHPIQIVKGFELACEEAVNHLKKIATPADNLGGSRARLIKTAKTTLSSKFVSSCKDHLAEIAVDAVLGVADMDRKDVNFELIRVEGRTGGSLEESKLVEGIVLDKCLSHPQMPSTFKDAKVALLTCAFEPPKPKTKHFVIIESVEQYKQLYEQEQKYFVDMVRMCKESGADLIFCQWGFDDEANHLLLREGLPAVRWVGGVELESLAIATGAKIIARFEDMSPKKLGKAAIVRQISLGGTEKALFIEGCSNSNVRTVFLRAGSSVAISEAKRCVHDALCAVRNLIKDERILYGGGSCEASCSMAVLKKTNSIKGISKYGFEAFGMALEAIPHALAENAGFDAIETVSLLKKSQKDEKSPFLGISTDGIKDMREMSVFESFIGKRQQLQLATQVAKIVLKTDDVIKSGELEFDM